MNDGERLTEATRVVQTVERFRSISDLNMRGLPIFNEDIQVEAVGFRPYNDDLLGILITPWFMNLILLPQQKIEMDYSAVGSPSDEVLPSGTWQFRCGGDEVVGLYRSLSLHSPMFAFNTHEHARIEAEQRLDSLLTPPRNKKIESDQTAAPRDPGRRSFLRGLATG